MLCTSLVGLLNKEFSLVMRLSQMGFCGLPPDSFLSLCEEYALIQSLLWCFIWFAAMSIAVPVAGYET